MGDAARRAAAPDPRWRLVIADDDAAMRGLVRFAVGAWFDEVVEVGDGRALLWDLMASWFASTPGHAPHALIVTDLHMPLYSGLDVADAWREVQPEVPVLLITAFPSAEQDRRAREVGAAMLAKPFSLAELRGAVKALHAA